MNEANGKESPRKRYFLRVLELAKTDPELNKLMPKAAVKDAAWQPGLSYDHLIATVLDGYGERPALGERDYRIVRDEASGRHRRQLLPAFATITYDQLHKRVKGLANAWRHQDAVRVNPGDFVCILGFTSTDYVTVELACAYAQGVSVPLQTTLAGADLGQIFADTNPAALVATVADLEIAARLAVEHGAIPAIIAMDYDPRDDDEREQFAAAQAELARAGVNTRMIALTDLIALGEDLPWEFLPPSDQGPERMATLVHSSGSTGTPKGAIIPERAAKSMWMNNPNQLPTVGICFAPMNHLMGRASVFSVLTQGGTAYFTAKPDMSTLFEDIRLARPTYINFFPRVFELIYQHFQNEVLRRTSAGEGTAETVAKQVREEMGASFLGDRLRGGSISAAPSSPAVRDFIRECFDILLLEVYGTTESGNGGVTLDNRVQRPPVTDYRLRDVPELGYYTTDKPYPRGEFCFKSAYAISGYYKRPEATEGLFDEDGFQCTGDIVEERGPDHVVVIDRRNDVLKLSQGEYVAVGPLGTVFESGSPVIKQIYLYGNSLRAYILAVVVPEMEVVDKLLGSDADDDEIRALIRRELHQVGQAAKLRTFEVPRDFIVEREPFSHENGLLSSVRKRMRPNLKRKYGDRLEALYEELERKQQEDLKALKDPNSRLTVAEKIAKLLAANLGLDQVDPAAERTYAELGGDSLGAVLLSIAIEDVFGVAVPANAILGPTGTPGRWARTIAEALREGGAHSPSFASIHGKGARQIHGKDLDIARFLDAHTLAGAAQLPSASPAPRTVLLTGANGFLGRFLCLAWLETLAKSGGKLICLIRAGDNGAARQRLDQIFAGPDPELAQHYRTLAERHLEVLAGDVAEVNCGLSDHLYQRLAGEVERIVHPAALVNHMLAYEHLFGPNVVGTAEVVRLALTGCKKPIDFISTVAVQAHLVTDAGNDEDSPLKDSIALGDGYAAGYGASKWAAEQVLLSAHRQFALPVNVFRGDMMLAHQRYQGQINASDMFTRLLYSVIATGLAPASFYQLDGDGKRARAHYDGTPVDVIAAAVVGVGAAEHGEFRTYNIQNYHSDDGVSLDTIVDWVASAGYPLERIGDHRQWFEAFEQKLANLPEEQRQHSSINVLGAVRRPYPASETMPGCERFKAAVRNLAIGPEVPHLSEAFIHKCLADMRALGLIGEPPRAAAGSASLARSA